MFSLTIQDKNGQVVGQISFEGGSYRIGRLDECEITLPSSSVSRHHARIFVQSGRCMIEDLGSANGVLVDGQRVVGQRDLGSASQIKLGDYALFLEQQRQGAPGGQGDRVMQTLFIPRDADHHKLVRIYDSFAGEEFILSEAVNSIGRTDDNFILLSDPSISRDHARLLREGDTYTVIDLNSSNGSSVNNKPVKAPRVLKSGDHVKFGNVEFLFVPGDAEIDLRDYLKPPDEGSNFLIFAGVAALIMIGVALGGVTLWAMLQHKDGDDAEPVVEAVKPEKTVEDSLEAERAQARSALEREDWGAALTNAEEARALPPGDDEAKKLRAQAVKERDADAKLKLAEGYIEKGEHDRALEVLRDVAEGTVSHGRAQRTLEHTEKTVAHNLKNEAIRLDKTAGRNKKKLLEAHAKYVESLALVSDDADALKRIGELEKKMKKLRVKFTPFDGG
jgi:pSer/pThr/pTyr-binding forkhead associated (FHA) protein